MSSTDICWNRAYCIKTLVKSRYSASIICRAHDPVGKGGVGAQAPRSKLCSKSCDAKIRLLGIMHELSRQITGPVLTIEVWCHSSWHHGMVQLSGLMAASWILMSSAPLRTKQSDSVSCSGAAKHVLFTSKTSS